MAESKTDILRRQEIANKLAELKNKYGDWSGDIPLPLGLWTRGDLKIPHTRLKRLVQVVNDLVNRPLSQCRVLDLGCLDGLFSVEFALQGATTVGVEVREANIEKARFCKDALGLPNLEFRQDDVRNLSLESYGSFDAIICSGILYHLTAHDASDLVRTMHAMVERIVVIDTHIATAPREKVILNGREYWGTTYREYKESTTPEKIANLLWASADNPTSFWFTKPSILNLLAEAGFSSVYECFHPAHLNFGNPGMECHDRCTFVAIKAHPFAMKTSPSANNLAERWPESAFSIPFSKRVNWRFLGR